MKAGKITAKIRDAVQVCFMVDGKEVKRYRNIDIPDQLKELEILNFQFDVPADGRGQITFMIDFAPGILPKEYPAARARVARTPKQAKPKHEAKVPKAKPDEATMAITPPPQSEKPSTPQVKDVPLVAKEAQTAPKPKEEQAVTPKATATETKK